MLAQVLRRTAGPALLVGGALMIAAEVIVWIVGLQTGKLAPNLGASAPYVLTHIGYLAAEVPVLFLGVGLLGVYVRLNGQMRGLGIAGAACVALSLVAATAALAIPGNGTNSLVGSVGGIALVLGTALLAVAALRTGIVPRAAALILVCTDVLFIPLLFATPLPFGPDWASDFLAFFVSGVGYTVTGAGLAQDGRAAEGTLPRAHQETSHASI